MKVSSKNGMTSIALDESSLHIQVEAAGDVWNWGSAYRPTLTVVGGETLDFSSAEHILHEEVHNGIGNGIRSRYEGFVSGGKKLALAFETYVWVEDETQDVFFEWIPFSEDKGLVEKVLWPGYMEFENGRDDWYTLLTWGQGLLLRNTWKEEVKSLAFDGMFLTEGSYMPWFSQIREGKGYIAIALTPWNAGVSVDHPENGPYTHASVRWEPDLGMMRERRILRLSFRENCDYNDMCGIYRQYVFENGLAATLEEKAARLPSVNRLPGCQFVHFGIKTNVNPKSDFYDPAAPDKNNHLTTFAVREAQIRRYHELGIEKLYMHLDGWAEPGYDNQHPDYLPACMEAGGWEGMKHFADAMHGWKYLFGIHDQYRDYYLDAPSFDEDYAVQLTDGTHPEHARWAGGPQSYLCASQAQYYVKRNFGEMKRNGIELDGAYLDVFTCNEGDECDNPRHRMSRRECYIYRKHCFDWLIAHGILPSSEEVADWSMNSLVFCHYAPYAFMLTPPGTPKKGVPVPLFNLVYHDCVIQPWMMEKHEGEDYMLYALLNGGAPYLVRDGAYVGADGSYDVGGMPFEEHVERCRVVAALHETVAKCRMLSHHFLDGDDMCQETKFSDGTCVRIDLREGTWEIQ